MMKSLLSLLVLIILCSCGDSSTSTRTVVIDKGYDSTQMVLDSTEIMDSIANIDPTIRKP